VFFRFNWTNTAMWDDPFNRAAAAVLNVVNYITDRLWLMALMAGVVYLVRIQVPNSQQALANTVARNQSQSQSQQQQQQQRNTSSTDPKDPRHADDDPQARYYREEMRRVRAQQQEIAQQRAMEAEKRRKEKQAHERMRRNLAAGAHDFQGGTVGGGAGDGQSRGTTARKRTTTSTSTSTTTTTSTTNSSSSRAEGYNPMQPWTAGTGGYRPPSRTIRRG